MYEIDVIQKWGLWFMEAVILVHSQDKGYVSLGRGEDELARSGRLQYWTVQYGKLVFGRIV